jgi:DNA-binding LytR/AlgR family response regulator
MSREIRKILVVDDNHAVHEDYRKVLEPDAEDGKLKQLESLLFGEKKPTTVERFQFAIDSAFQGEDGLNLVKESIAAGSPYAAAFIDMRMPPGWNGIRTAQEIWNVDSNLPIVICTAYTDYTWEEIVAELPRSELLLILKKPFDNIELKQMATSQSELRQLVEMATLSRQEIKVAFGK